MRSLNNYASDPYIRSYSLSLIFLIVTTVNGFTYLSFPFNIINCLPKINFIEVTAYSETSKEIFFYNFGECVGNLTRRNHPTSDPLGCYIFNNALNKDTLNGLSNLDFADPYKDRDQNLMDPALCIIYCADYLFKYAARRRGKECRCGNENGLDGYILTSTTYCNMTCVGNSSYMRGGENTYAIYEVGYIKDSPYCNQRSLNGYSIERSGMTVEMCIGYCKQKNFEIVGLEIGSQCFCDHDFNSYTNL
ncbi:7777_t:CDS:2, partial [Dentiscutata erythropus]